MLFTSCSGTTAALAVYTNRMEHRPTDAEAIVRARSGDSNAFGVLVTRYQEAAFRAAYLIARNADDAADIAQEAFVRAHAQLHRFRLDDPFRPWLLRIVTNMALNDRRSRGRRLGRQRETGQGARRLGEPDPVEERAGQSPYCDRRVFVDAQIAPEEARFVIRDEGPGFDPASLPDPTDPENLLRASGRVASFSTAQQKHRGSIPPAHACA